MLNNLKAEMARSGVTICAIAGVIGKGERTVRERLKGHGCFSFSDAVAVRNAFFPEADLEYLFARAERDKDSA